MVLHGTDGQPAGAVVVSTFMAPEVASAVHEVRDIQPAALARAERRVRKAATALLD